MLIAGGWQRRCSLGLILSIHLTNVYSVPAEVLGSVAQAPARCMCTRTHTHMDTHTLFCLENQGMQLHRNYHSGKNSPRRNKKEASSCPVPYRQLSQPGIHGLPEVYLLGLGVKGASVSDLFMGLKGQALHSPLGASAPSKCGQTARLARWAMPQDSRPVVRAAEIRPGSCPPRSASSSAAV